MVGLLQVSALIFLGGIEMFWTIDQAHNAYRALLAEFAQCYLKTLGQGRLELREMGLPLNNIEEAIIRDPDHWNSRERYDLVVLEARLSGAETTLGLSEKEIEEGRSAAGLPDTWCRTRCVKKEVKKAVAV